MTLKLPPELESEIAAIGIESLERGRAVRRLDVLLTGLVLTSLLILAAVFGLTEGYLIAVTVAVATLCVIWALMSVSASLHLQFDQLATIIVYYAEREPKG